SCTKPHCRTEYDYLKLNVFECVIWRGLTYIVLSCLAGSAAATHLHCLDSSSSRTGEVHEDLASFLVHSGLCSVAVAGRVHVPTRTTYSSGRCVGRPACPGRRDRRQPARRGVSSRRRVFAAYQHLGWQASLHWHDGFHHRS